MATQVLLIRHGRTVWNQEARFRGQADVPLDSTGQHEAKVTARYVAARWPLSAVYTSPLSRALETAQAIAQAQGLQAQPLTGLLDLNFGQWQGLALAEVRVHYPDLLRAWFEAPHTVRFPEGEGLQEVRQRAASALRETVHRHPSQTVALVAHTVVNQVLLCAVLGLGNDSFWQFRQDTCAINVIEWDGNQYRLALMNDTSHIWRAEQG